MIAVYLDFQRFLLGLSGGSQKELIAKASGMLAQACLLKELWSH
jgi:hypothetical protein